MPTGGDYVGRVHSFHLPHAQRGEQDHHFAARLPDVHVRRSMLTRWEQDHEIEPVHAKYGRHG